MYCRNCGAKINDEDVFCRNCGTAVIKDDTEKNTQEIQPEKQEIVNSEQEQQQMAQPQPEQQTLTEQKNDQQNVVQSKTVDQPRPTQQVQAQSNSQVNSTANNMQKSSNSKATFDSQKIIITIVLGVVFFIIGFMCCKYYIAHRVSKYIDSDRYYYDDYSYNTNNDYSSDNYDSNSYDLQENNTETASAEENNSTIVTNNYVMSEDGRWKVAFKVPSTLKINTELSDEELVVVNKNNDTDLLRVMIEIRDESLNEFIREVNDEYLDENSYANARVSEVQTMNVNNKEFNYITIDYTYAGYPMQDKYIVYKLDNNNLFGVQLEHFSNLTDSELNELLTISVIK